MRKLVLKRLFAASFGIAGVSFPLPVAAAPTVTETTTGSAGAWTYNFGITNTLGGTNNIYFFGVASPGATGGLPPGWSIQSSYWTNAGSGDWSKVYNQNWITDPSSKYTVKPGQTLGGFQVLDPSLTATTSFNWFAYAYGGAYTGGDNFHNSSNPGFEGTVATSATRGVPEPATWAMMLLGFGAIGFAMRRRKAPRPQLA